jgi:Tetracyclin repressor-like, C-terminal domain
VVTPSHARAVPAVHAVQAERHRHPEFADALYSRVFEPAGRRFTATVLHHYAEVGQLDPALITPVVEDIGEALVMRHAIDTGEEPTPQRLAEIVDQAILPAVRGYPGER